MWFGFEIKISTIPGFQKASYGFQWSMKKIIDIHGIHPGQQRR